MKVKSKALALLVALAAGAAQAQNTLNDGTAANTKIENTATSSYPDPSNPNGPLLTTSSNTVVTTVLPKPGFDIVYADGTDGLMDGVVSLGNTPVTAKVTDTVLPGGSRNTPYLVVNNGNTTQTIGLGSVTSGTGVTVAYYLDSDKDGVLSLAEQNAGPINTIALAYDNPDTTTDEGIAYFIQVLTVPTNVAPGNTYSASPVGTGQTFDAATRLPVDNTPESATVLGLQYTTVTIANRPPVPADVTNAGTLYNSAAATTISGLVASDPDTGGSIASYTIKTLPDPLSGVLYLSDGTTPVTVDMVLTPAQAASLKFDPVAGFVGNATFDYIATDNLGLVSTSNKNSDATVTPGAATFTIPVSAALPTITGRVYEDYNYGGGTGRAYNAAQGMSLRPNATVELYDSAGAFVSSTTTDANGVYTFTGLSAGSYTVRVVNSTVTSSRTGYVSTLIPVQTFVNGSGTKVGGEAPAKVDAAAGATGSTLSSLTTTSAAPESISTLTVGTSNVTGVDFGFNFDTIVNTNASGQGSLAQFITNSNALNNTGLAQAGSRSRDGTPEPLPAGTETSIFMIPSAALTGGVAVIKLPDAATSGTPSVLPAVTDTMTSIDGTTQTVNIGDTNSGSLGTGGSVGYISTATLTQVPKPEVQIQGPTNGNQNALYGLVIASTASTTTVRGVSMLAFGANNATYKPDSTASIYVNGASGALLEQNFLGSAATSFGCTSTSTNTGSGSGVYALNAASGTLTHNLIGCNGANGALLSGAGSNKWTISNNEFRGNGLLGTNWDGVNLSSNSTNNTITGNLFTDNKANGIDTYYGGSGNIISSNTVTGNGKGYVGALNADETPGIRLFASGTTVRNNEIALNYGAGVMVVANYNGNLISQNSIYDNGTVTANGGAAASQQIGIDLVSSTDTSASYPLQPTKSGMSPYVTPNDSGDADNGGNNALNFPVFETAISDGTNVTLTGWARPGSTIELFVAAPDPSGFGEGKTYLVTLKEGSTADTDATTGTYAAANKGTVNGTATSTGTDTTNRFKFVVPLTSLSGVSVGTPLTATATCLGSDCTGTTVAANSTSEFSPNIIVTPPSADLQISKTFLANGVRVTQGTKAPGSTVYYYILVTNNGPAPVTNPVVKDALPSGMTFNAISCSSTANNVCTSTVPAPTSAQLQSGYAIPTTLASGAFYELLITATVTSPNVTGTRYADNTATITAPTGITEINTANNTSTARVLLDAPPIPNDLTNTLLLSSAPATTLSLPLSGTDSDGTIVSYAVTQLPTAASGVLYLSDGTTPVTVGMVLTPAQAASLMFDPAAGFAGTATFQYTATDNDNLTSTYAQPSSGAPISRAAIYSIPVSSTNTALPCTSTVYGIFGSAPRINTTLTSIDASGNPGAAITSLPYTDTAAMAVSTDGVKIFVAGQDKLLRMYNVTTGVWTTLGTLPYPSGYTARPVRMTIDKNGVGYVSVADVIWTFNGNATGTTDANISAAKTLSFTNASGISPAPDFGSVGNQNVSGDLISDNDGNLYLLANPVGQNYMDIFRIQGATGSTPSVTYAGRLRDTDIGSATMGGFAAIPSGIYASTDGGRYLNADLSALSMTVVNPTLGITSDLGSCYYPTLRPDVNSTKTVSNVTTGGTIANAGDTLEYTITIKNTGNLSAEGVTLQDAIPAGATYVAGSTTVNGSALSDVSGSMPYVTAQSVKSPATGTVASTDIMNGQVIAGSDVVVKFRVTVNSGVTSVSNQGTVAYKDNSTGTTVGTTTLTDGDSTTPPKDPTVIGAGNPTLTIDKKVDTKFLRVTPSTTNDTQLTLNPTQLTYTLTVKNTGSAAANNVKVTDTLPAGLTYVSSSGTPALASAATVSNQDLSFSIATLAAGATQTITVLVDASVTANVNQNAFSNTASTSADSVSSVTSTPAVTDLVYPKLTKTVQNLTRGTPASTTLGGGQPGDVLEYCIAFNNYSSVPLDGYSITDQVPAKTAAKTSAYGSGLGVKVTRATVTNLTSAADTDDGQLTTSGGTYSEGTLSVKLGTVAKGESGSVCFQVTIR